MAAKIARLQRALFWLAHCQITVEMYGKPLLVLVINLLRATHGSDTLAADQFGVEHIHCLLAVTSAKHKLRLIASWAISTEWMILMYGKPINDKRVSKELHMEPAIPIIHLLTKNSCTCDARA